MHPIMLNNLFHGSHAIGFGRSVRASAGMVLGMEALALVLVKTDYPKYVREGSEPAGRGQVALTVALKKFATDWKYVMMIMGFVTSINRLLSARRPLTKVVTDASPIQDDALRPGFILPNLLSSARRFETWPGLHLRILLG